MTQAEPGSIALHPDDPFPLGDGLPCPHPIKYQDLDTLSHLTPFLKALLSGEDLMNLVTQKENE